MLIFRSIERRSCSEHTCRDVREKSCHWGWSSGIWSIWSYLCNWVTKTICDGACIAWDIIPSRVINTLVTAGSCLQQVGRELVAKTRCIRHLPQCAQMAGCYASFATQGALKCTTGLITPSEECLRQNKFIE